MVRERLTGEGLGELEFQLNGFPRDHVDHDGARVAVGEQSSLV